MTNEAGYFEIGVEGEAVTLEISFIGYESRKVVVHEHDGKITIVLNQSSVKLNQIQINGSEVNNLTNISKIDINVRPIKSAQDVLQIVPGLFIAQHAGGGKAEQIFLRGFDTDHGTDIAITADGILGNMVSHAHGQGYADMHFVIPELINIADFGKGPYFTDKGNLNTAGYVDLKTFNTLNRSLVKMEAGDFITFRTLAIVNLLGNGVTRQGHNAYMAADFNLSDGPFESPQNFDRLNFFAKYAGYYSDRNFLTMQISGLNSKWDASGQIPDRPANEDNSIVALGYTVINFRLNYTRKSFEVFAGVENIFNAEWNEAQFATLSRLQNEPEPVEELHYTPGTPLFVKGGVAVFF